MYTPHKILMTQQTRLSMLSTDDFDFEHDMIISSTQKNF